MFAAGEHAAFSGSNDVNYAINGSFCWTLGFAATPRRYE